MREGQLTMIVYGANEALGWARRVAAFQHAMRCGASLASACVCVRMCLCVRRCLTS